MNDIITIKNVRGRVNADGVAELNLEDVARGLGFTQRQNKNCVEYESIRWERIRGYFEEFGFPPLVGENSDIGNVGALPEFIPENIFYKLCFKASNETARTFQDLVTDEILPSIRKHGVYAIERILEEPDALIAAIQSLKAERDRAKTQAADASRQLEDASIQLDRHKDWLTVKRVANINGLDWRDLDWHRLKGVSGRLGYSVRKIFDANYGTVNAYHIEVWRQTYPRLNYE